jgi:hypothetical protein
VSGTHNPKKMRGNRESPCPSTFGANGAINDQCVEKYSAWLMLPFALPLGSNPQLHRLPHGPSSNDAGLNIARITARSNPTINHSKKIRQRDVQTETGEEFSVGQS